MKQEIKKYTVIIGGEQYTIMSDESEHCLMQAVELLQTLIPTKSPDSSFDNHKYVALAALQLATRILTLESNLKEERLKQEELVSFVDFQIRHLG
jgi:hypothetical protein